MKTSNISVTQASKGYELLDSGDGEKLERFGPYVLLRPDPQALWPKRLPEAEWKKADAYFIRGSDKAEWTMRTKLPEKWEIEHGGNGGKGGKGGAGGGLKFWIKPTAFKHTGLFPEQAPNWEWLMERISEKNSAGEDGGGGEVPGEMEVLNLFGYTGGATLACAKAGAKVVHIDGSKAAVTWARENAELSGLKDKPVRWIIEDARIFVERELRRGRAYDGIIMDPPAFGHGPSSELWKIEDDFLPLLENCMKLLKPEHAFFLINGYASGYSALAYENNLVRLVERFGGKTEFGELAIMEKGGKGGKGGDGQNGRLLPAGIFGRWSK